MDKKSKEGGANNTKYLQVNLEDYVRLIEMLRAGNNDAFNAIIVEAEDGKVYPLSEYLSACVLARKEVRELEQDIKRLIITGKFEVPYSFISQLISAAVEGQKAQNRKGRKQSALEESLGIEFIR